MQIKRLELVGFKSFVDPTVVEFDSPLVGIVGPNGCGKSNVVDAIRWVMGEMSAKSLRGRAMEDVIFNGSEARPAVGMAEVSLTFSTEDGIVPPQYAGFSEITITRRLFRDGESEYLINKVPARHKDIVELFLGTGAGHKAYSVVEQGKIDFAINARPEERRLLIEEVAGISKFKVRKEAALRRIELTQQNIARLKDILAEVSRQINSLERQVKKAERYRELRDEIRELDLKLAGANYHEGVEERQELEGLLAEWNRRESNAQAELSRLEAEREKHRLELSEKEREISRVQERIFEFSSRLKLLEAEADYQGREIIRLEMERERSTGLIQQGEKLKIDLEKLDQELFQLTDRYSSAHQQSEELKAEMARLRNRKESLDQDLQIRREEVGGKRSRLKSLIDLERNFEGYAEGVRTVLKARKEGVQKEGILGVVADFVDSPPDYEMAVSAALGEKLQYVIVKSHEEGVEAVSFLKTQATGRSTFIALDIHESEALPFPYEKEGVVGPLLNFVKLREEYARIATHLLGDVVLVKSLSDAITLWRSNGHKKTLVTLEGEVVDPFGVVSGGTTGLPGKLLLEKKREIKALREEVARLEEEIGLKEDSVSQFEGTLSGMISELDGLKKKEHEEDLSKIGLEKERDGFLRELTRLDKEGELVRLSDQKLEELRQKRGKGAEEREVLQGELKQLTIALESLRVEHGKRSEAIQAFEASLKNFRKEYDLSRSHTGDLKVTLSRLESDLLHLEQQILEKYSVRLSELAAPSGGGEIDRPLEEQHLAEMKERLQKMGDVNSGAIAECDELRTRQEFLTKQIQDLEEAIEGLKKAIQKINHTTKIRFEETYALVNERFRALFPRLFSGGRAELRLTEGEDPLNVGVDLFVQPPGKKLSHIGLLSGGEKALSAVAFIFSIFLVKPSPFCILDEVDAPLDDANVDRFHKLLSEILPRSQFILITHNRRTMEQCHILYGVTMQEPGISKLVSVKLNESLPLAS